MVTAPLVGWLADRYPRRLIMCVGALLWSAATLLTAVTHNFTELMIRHTLVGVGEATFVAIAPSFLSDLHPEYRRGQSALSLLPGDPGGYGAGIPAGRSDGGTLGLARAVSGGRGAGCAAGVASAAGSGAGARSCRTGWRSPWSAGRSWGYGAIRRFGRRRWAWR